MNIIWLVQMTLFILVSIYLLVCLLLYISQEKFIFFPAKLSPNYPFSQFKNFDEVLFPVSENVTIHALHFNVDNSKGIVLYFHGNARGLESWGFAAEEFVEQGYEVLMPDYRGYGKSSGTINEQGFYSDANYIYKYLLDKYKEENIIIYGRSLGTGIACELARQSNPKMLVLVTPYLSIVKLSQKAMPILPISLLLKFRFENDKKIDQIKCPIHIFHGTKDELIPLDHAVKLASLSGQQSILTIIEGSEHNNITEFSEYKNKLKKLLQ